MRISALQTAGALVATALWVAPSLVRAAEREVWKDSRVRGSPEVASPYRLERAYPKLKFDGPLDAVTIPGSQRMVVVEQFGRLFSFPSEETVASADLFGDLKEYDPEAFECYGIAFHPAFEKNRFAYVWLNLDLHGKRTMEDGTHIVRFRVTEESPPRLDFSSGQVIFQWVTGGHNGGNLRFGPDGMLYVATGDAGTPDPPDPLATGQDISDVLASVLRIDVDHPEAGKAYRIPTDNPFVKMPGARGEVWAYGFRNPWRLSFDPKTGALFVGDVGWELWEMIHRVERGGNYGWSITEAGRQDVWPDRPRGPTPIQPPLIVHPHQEAASITGGEFYHGRKLPALQDAYIYGDWQLGTFWAWRDGRVQELCRSTLMPGGFGVPPDGELIICDHGGGGLWRFLPNPEPKEVPDFPRKLSETGLFTDVEKQKPSAGVIAYTVNAPRWADTATAERWIAVPSAENVTVAGKEFGVMVKERWVFPKDTVFAKTYTLALERGNPASRRKVETQVLHFDGIQWAAYSYRWNEAQKDADLLPTGGGESVFSVKDAGAPGGVRSQTWRYFSRMECLRCHNLWNNFVPGFSALQLDVAGTSGGESQLMLLARMGLANVDAKGPSPLREPSTVEGRARSYLHANCSTCHRESAGGAVPSFLNIDTALEEARLLEAKPVQGALGLPEGRIVAPGDACRSVLLYRMSTSGRGHMPYLGGQMVDESGVKLVREWIDALPGERGLPGEIGERRAVERAGLARLAGGDPAPLDSLLASASGALGVASAIAEGTLKGELRERVVKAGSALADPLRRDLFERFLPDAERRTMLGPKIDPAKVLIPRGDAARGGKLFAGLCATCHRVADSGTDFGPELTHIATKYERAALLQQILQPSLVVDPQWQLATFTLKNGEVIGGFVTAEAGADLLLKLPGGVAKTISRGEIVKTTKERVSAMPEGLMQSLTAQEAADLLDYVGSLK